MSALQILSETRCFAGRQGFYRHNSTVLGCAAEFSLFLPPGEGPFPLLWYLSGLTCTPENATTKAGFQRVAAELGLAVLCPDTSPRGPHVADDDAYDLGQGAGFYLTATEPPWADHYRMDTYILDELSDLVFDQFALDQARQAVTGHSMGGHGALTLYLKNRKRFRSVSAFAPIVSPTRCPWGQKAFGAYLGTPKSTRKGTPKSTGAAYDACLLLEKLGSDDRRILIDVGLADPFLEAELKLDLFEDVCEVTRQPLTLRRHEGYDHSYYFIASFIEDHLRHHAEALAAT